jgi:hypothetical protein
VEGLGTSLKVGVPTGTEGNYTGLKTMLETLGITVTFFTE